MKKVIVIGGGAAGMLAAVSAREMGADVAILEKNKLLGKKMLITGKGRCNITNAGTKEDIIKNIPGNGQFLYSVLNNFSNQDTIDFFNRLGIPTKIERGNRVFPVSDKASDVVDALMRHLRKMGVKIRLETNVDGLSISHGKIQGVWAEDSLFSADAVIIATGGASYPGTGSTGDGYHMAKKAGHSIVPLKPSLVPLETAEQWVKELQGLSLKNVKAIAYIGEKVLAYEFGEMLFTHFGISGPIVLSLSKPITEGMRNNPKINVRVSIDLKPALSEQQLDLRIQRDFQKYARKHFTNAFGDLLPKSLIPVILKRLPVPEEKFVHQISKEERGHIVKLLKDFSFTVTKPRPLSEAIVTAGGVCLKEVNPKTLESKIVPGLFFAGEVLDIDGFTGGYNLQAAFSTGYGAGLSAAE